MKPVRTGAVLLCALAAVFTISGSAMAGSVNFEGFALGTVNGQGGWTVVDQWGNDAWGNNGTAFDQEVQDDGTGNTVWRLSNAVTTGGLSAQPFSQTTVEAAGETGSALWNDKGPDYTHPLSPPLYGQYATANQFEASFDFRSATGAAQPGLAISVSASAKQVDGRMSYIQLVDNGASGLDVYFYATGTVADPWGASATWVQIASDLSYTGWHNIGMSIDFVDGLQNVGGDLYGNDIVNVSVDGTPAYTGTSWETYWATDPYGTGGTYAVNSLTFDARGTAEPSTLGGGFYFDNVDVSTTAAQSAVPEPMTMLALGMGVVGLGGYIRKRRMA